MIGQPPDATTWPTQDGFLAPRDFVDVEDLVSRLKTRAAGRSMPTPVPLEPVDQASAEAAEPDISEALAAQAELNGLIVGVLTGMGEWLRRLEVEMDTIKQQIEAGQSRSVSHSGLNQLRTSLRLSMAMIEALTSERGGGASGQS